MDMVFVGHLTMDDVILFEKPPMLDCPGGAALYAASGAYMHSKKRIELVSRLGTDFNTGFLERAGLDLSAVQLVENVPTIHLFTMYDRMGLRYFIVQRWAGSYDRMAPTPQDFPDKLKDASKCYHIAAFPLPRQQAMIEAIPDGALLSVDPHHDYIYPEQHEIWQRLLKKITVFQPSEDELIRYFAIPVQKNVSDYVPYVKELAAKGPEVVVLKLGAKGALGYEKKTDTLAFVPPVPAPVVDVTGCGDCFCGGFLASYCEERNLTKALVSGAVSASFNITHFGVEENFSIPAEAVKARLDQYYQQWKGLTI